MHVRRANGGHWEIVIPFQFSIWDAFVVWDGERWRETDYPFQFSIWDAERCCPRCVVSQSAFQFSIWDAYPWSAWRGLLKLHSFQFSIWDAGVWDGYTAAVRYTAFNSLFEMHIQESIFPAYNIIVLSILYLRCAGAGRRCANPLRASRLSILYLRCPPEAE